MELIETALEKVGSLKDLLGSITDGDTAAALKDKLVALVPTVLSAMKGLDAIPGPAKALLGDKVDGIAKLFDGVKGQAGKLMENADIKSKIGDILGQLTG